jgi:hypothetical protein
MICAGDKLGWVSAFQVVNPDLVVYPSKSGTCGRCSGEKMSDFCKLY